MVPSIIVQPDEKRDAKAAQLAENGYLWPVITLRKAHGAFPAGTVAYGVPSSKEGASYIANRLYCSCPDYKRAICKHQRAVIRFEESKVRPARQGYSDLYGFCQQAGCQEDRERDDIFCEKHALVDAF